MAGTRFHSRQTTHRALLEALFHSLPADGKELDDILEAINDEFIPPLRMKSNDPVSGSAQIDIASIFATTSETSRRRTIPPISNLLPNFTSGTLTFPAANTGDVTVSPGSNYTLVGVGADQWVKIGVNLDATGNLNLTQGTPGASEAAATNPPTVPNTFAVGYIAAEYSSGALVNMTDANVVQYVGGGGGGSGTGDANSFLETLKNMLQDSVYELVTPVIFSIDTDSFVDGSSTGSYSLVSNTFEMDTGETFVSTNLLDPNEFLDEGIDIAEVDIAVKWDNDGVDDSATYEISRDGGNEYQTLSMERVGDGTATWVGTHRFDVESSFSSLVSDSSTGNSGVLSDTSQQSLAMEFTLANPAMVNEISLEVTKTGSPSGYLYVAIAEDASGVPGTVLSQSQAIAMSGISTGTLDVTMPDTVLAAGTYHYIVSTDADYKSSYSVGVTQLSIDADSASSGASKYDGSSWTDFTSYSLNFNVKGRTLDLRVRVTSSADSKALEGLGAFYSFQTGELVTGLKNIEVFKFKSVTDNDNEFTLTRFVPDPDLLKCYYVETGQVFLNNANGFQLEGQKVVFPIDTFNNGGVESDVTLIFQQVEGSSFDNSDSNALLLASNFLGSTDGSLDKSAPGRGIFLRRPDGTLREIAIGDDDKIKIYSV